MQRKSARLNPTSPEGYAKVMADPALQEFHQDTLDAFLHDRIYLVRIGLLDRGWSYIAGSDGPNSPLLLKGDFVFNTVFTKVGPGANVVGLSYELDRKPFRADNITQTPDQLAGDIDAAATKQVILQSLVDDFGWVNQGDDNRLLHWVTKDIGGGIKSSLNPEGIRRICAKVEPFLLHSVIVLGTLGDNILVSAHLEDGLAPTQQAKALDDIINAIDPNQTRDITEYYQWQRNKQGGQTFGNQLSIVPLTKALFDEHVASCVKVKDFAAYQEAYPDVSHLELTKRDDGRVVSGGVGSLYELRPSQDPEGWVIKVDSFDSEAAIAHGNSADQEDDEVVGMTP
jgi:hypothetical protein